MMLTAILRRRLASMGELSLPKVFCASNLSDQGYWDKGGTARKFDWTLSAQREWVCSAEVVAERDLAGPLLPDGLSGLMHGALLGSSLAKLGVHEFEADSGAPEA
jgi:hypothetical protein